MGINISHLGRRAAIANQRLELMSQVEIGDIGSSSEGNSSKASKSGVEAVKEETRMLVGMEAKRDRFLEVFVDRRD